MFQPWYSYKISSYKKMKNEFSVKNPHMSNIYSPLVQVVKSKTQVVRVVKRRLAPLERPPLDNCALIQFSSVV